MSDVDEDDRVLPGDTTVPVWVMLAIGLGLVALSGWTAAAVLATMGAVVWWLVGGADEVAGPGRGTAAPPPRPGIWP
jgi:hypothetical protein